ncbi:portal protein [Sediminicoccus sp. BL-A-41-H5]|uniref:portal protein n=1 Tax=Sediminicoccus sp. BL-A-41-H5 TaxID=3421106 RepID=UPI003D668A85
MTPQQILARHDAAISRRRPHESNWRDAYAHVLPAPHEAATLYDATAADAAEQLAASLLAELTPPWSRWFGLAPAHGQADPAEAAALEETAQTLQAHLDRSNFAVEMHQAFLDLVITGTGIMLVEEAPPGEATALRFTAVPVRTAVLEEGATGRLDTVFREARLSTGEMLRRFPFAEIPAAMQREAAAEADEAEPAKHRLIEAVWPDGQGHRYAAVFDAPGLKTPIFVAQGRFADAPFIAFRWLKAPGEVYGRGPVIKALPDIRTANRVVELVLKNASIAVTGIWQAEDDGVLNPATVQLTPGAIIPKAPGSAGLTPLAAPGDFDVSQLVLNDLRARIRTALLADRLGTLRDQRMTATEVLERSAETARLLGATYGRLQSELLTPLIARSLAILARRGEVPPVLLEQGRVALRYESPLARVQGRADAANTLLFLDAVSKMGAAAVAEVDAAAAARWLARTLGAPAEILAPSVQPE